MILTFYAVFTFVTQVTALLIGSLADVTGLLVEMAEPETMRACVYKALVVAGSCLALAQARGGIGAKLRAAMDAGNLSVVVGEWAEAAGTAEAREAAEEVRRACGV